MSNKSPLIACISLCLIDDKFHKDEKRYLEDICEEEWELSVDEVQNVHDEIKDKGINQFKNFFYEFTEKVPDNEKEYYFELFTDLAEVDGYLHSKEILLLDQLQKIWNIKKEASSIFVPSKEQKEIIEGGFQLKTCLDNIKSSQSYKKWSPSKWTRILEGINASESSFRLEIYRNNPFKKYLAFWLNNWRHIDSPITGDELIAQGWESGPGLGIEIKRQRMKLIDEQNII